MSSRAFFTAALSIEQEAISKHSCMRERNRCIARFFQPAIFVDTDFKRSFADKQPFRRLLTRSSAGKYRARCYRAYCGKPGSNYRAQ